MGTIKVGDRVRISDGATGRVIAVVNCALYRVRYDERDPLGNQTGDYLLHVLKPHKGKPQGWR